MTVASGAGDHLSCLIVPCTDENRVLEGQPEMLPAPRSTNFVFWCCYNCQLEI